MLPAGGTSALFECAAQDGTSVLLKLTPDRGIAAGEAAALEAWTDSPHVVRLLDTDLDQSVLLLEHLRPGVPLAQDPAGWTLTDIAPVLADLWSSRPHPEVQAVPPLRERVDFLFDLTHWTSPARPTRARPAPAAGTPRPVAQPRSRPGRRRLGWPRAGDLDPGNVLRSGRGAVAIDPRPCIGDRTFDAVDWVLVGTDGQGEIDRRIDRLTDHPPQSRPGPGDGLVPGIYDGWLVDHEP